MSRLPCLTSAPSVGLSRTGAPRPVSSRRFRLCLTVRPRPTLPRSAPVRPSYGFGDERRPPLPRQSLLAGRRTRSWSTSDSEVPTLLETPVARVSHGDGLLGLLTHHRARHRRTWDTKDDSSTGGVNSKQGEHVSCSVTKRVVTKGVVGSRRSWKGSRRTGTGQSRLPSIRRPTIRRPE